MLRRRCERLAHVLTGGWGILLWRHAAGRRARRAGAELRIFRFVKWRLSVAPSYNRVLSATATTEPPAAAEPEHAPNDPPHCYPLTARCRCCSPRRQQPRRARSRRRCDWTFCRPTRAAHRTTRCAGIDGRAGRLSRTATADSGSAPYVSLPPSVPRFCKQVPVLGCVRCVLA